MSAPSKYCRVASWQIVKDKKGQAQKNIPPPNSGSPELEKSVKRPDI